MHFITLRRCNDLLSVFLIVLAIYLCVWPALPSITWWVTFDAPIISHAPSYTLPEEAPDKNTLIIPRLELSQEIHEGRTESTLRKGVWHRPASSSPDKGSNTVLSGHRFTYGGKSVFYYLDKIQVNDEIYVYWDGKKHTYRVDKIFEVPPTETTIEQPTDDVRLTIYTCTPLLTAKNRLVVQAKLMEGQ